LSAAAAAKLSYRQATAPNHQTGYCCRDPHPEGAALACRDPQFPAHNGEIIHSAELAPVPEVGKSFPVLVCNDGVRRSVHLLIDMRSRSQFATLKQGQNIKYLPHAFTEHGALMAANVLNSAQAVAMSGYVIRAFVKLREDLAANTAILTRLAEIDRNLLLHDVALRDIYQKLRPLLEPTAPPPKPQIGFHVKEEAILYRSGRKSSRS
jgi:hypothetical protein